MRGYPAPCTLQPMPRRSSKDGLPTDPNEAAVRGVAILADKGAAVPRAPEKNPAAVALGRMGGKKGGQARAQKLSAERRSEIALRAAEARWQKSK